MGRPPQSGPPGPGLPGCGAFGAFGAFGLDAVVVAAPPGTHAALSVAAPAAGRPVDTVVATAVHSRGAVATRPRSFTHAGPTAVAGAEAATRSAANGHVMTVEVP
ncbi:hypothetical protein POF50_026030 [Streptomyces sp. SL13]|uniref:Uncharacterized protein n=1 Tax=Streptantibioticus silvisoli TaxID=2705255 RepID=A0AA90H3I9_9ACTN|nr:hypothetical protein [Streptantibioticus silvisoli]MDI5972759.1 hypothetical protein [Streptantibioticus silvisoli]